MFVHFCALLIFSSQHVSGSAYKIVSQRAYHHGTMLISTRLDHLGVMLRPEEVLLVLIRGPNFLSFPPIASWSFGLIHAATLRFSSLMTGKEDYPKTPWIFLLEVGFTNIFVSVFDRRTSSLKAFRPFGLRFAIWSNSTRPSRTKGSRPQLCMNSEENTRLIPRWIHFGGCLSVWVYLSSCFKCCMVEDLGARDIEYIRKGMSELSVIVFSIIYGHQSDFQADFNRRGIGDLEEPQNLQRPWGEIFLGGISYVYFFFPTLLFPWQQRISSDSWSPIETWTDFRLFSSTDQHANHECHVRIAQPMGSFLLSRQALWIFKRDWTGCRSTRWSTM